MSRTALHFSRAAKLILYGSVLTSFLSGSLWYVLHHWFVTEGDFGPQHSPAEPILIRIHGASAFIVMIVFGWVLGRHVPIGWRSQRSRKSGIVVITATAAMVLTGYSLYYLVGEESHDSIALLHLSLGWGLILTLCIHIWKAVKRRHQSSAQP
jgi:hypothetical protein